LKNSKRVIGSVRKRFGIIEKRGKRKGQETKSSPQYEARKRNVEPAVRGRKKEPQGSISLREPVSDRRKRWAYQYRKEGFRSVRKKTESTNSLKGK